MQNEEKLNIITKLAQSYILLLLKEYLSQGQISSVENLFKICPVELELIAPELNEFGKEVLVGGFATVDRIVIGANEVEHTNLDEEAEVDKLLSGIIHEYAHKIRAVNNNYGEMLEESFASIFTELCINNAKLKTMDKNEDTKEKEPFGMLNSVNYQKAESQVRAILYILKQKDLDKQMLVEFIAGDQGIFKSVCTQIFGDGFDEYYSLITNKENSNSEQLLLNLLTQYIKTVGLNINNYWDSNKNELSNENLYFQGSPTLARAVVNAGVECFKEDEQEAFNNFLYSSQTANEENAFIDNEKIERIKSYITTKFNVTGKDLAEVYDIVIDLCSSYIQYSNKTDEESQIFIRELNKAFPNIEDFKNRFVKLRVSGQDKLIFENLDLHNITYSDIIANMGRLFPQEEDSTEFGK